MMRVSYQLLKRTKNWKVEKSIENDNINFKTIRYKLTALGNIFPIIQACETGQHFKGNLNKKNKQAKNANSKKFERKLSKQLKFNIYVKTSLFSTSFVTATGFFFSQFDFKKSTNMNRYIKTTKF